MKKFERLPAEERKAEIMAAALELFSKKGFSSTTMENIVDEVTLSKGGVYRLYPSTLAILSDLIMGGMHMRNAYYAGRVAEESGAGRPITLEFIVGMVTDSLMMAPEVSNLWSEFLWEKRRKPELEALYLEIEKKSIEETVALIESTGASDALEDGALTLGRLTEIMNAFTLGLSILGWKEDSPEFRSKLKEAIMAILEIR